MTEKKKNCNFKVVKEISIEEEKIKNSQLSTFSKTLTLPVFTSIFKVFNPNASQYFNRRGTLLMNFHSRGPLLWNENQGRNY